MTDDGSYLLKEELLYLFLWPLIIIEKDMKTQEELKTWDQGFHT